MSASIKEAIKFVVVEARRKRPSDYLIPFVHCSESAKHAYWTVLAWSAQSIESHQHTLAAQAKLTWMRQQLQSVKDHNDIMNNINYMKSDPIARALQWTIETASSKGPALLFHLDSFLTAKEERLHQLSQGFTFPTNFQDIDDYGEQSHGHLLAALAHIEHTLPMDSHLTSLFSIGQARQYMDMLLQPQLFKTPLSGQELLDKAKEHLNIAKTQLQASTRPLPAVCATWFLEKRLCDQIQKEESWHTADKRMLNTLWFLWKNRKMLFN